MQSMVHQLTTIYITLADFFDHHPQLLHWRQSNHWAPAFTDAEVLTIAFMQSYFQTPTLKRTYLLVRANDPKAFPHLPSYQQWLARLYKLAPLVAQILAATTPSSDSQNDYYLLDSKPIQSVYRFAMGAFCYCAMRVPISAKTKRAGTSVSNYI